jgi:hypothetical protein
VLKAVTVAWAVAGVAVLSGFGWSRHLARQPGGGIMGSAVEDPLRLTLVVLLLAGTVLAWRWASAGAVVATVAACGWAFLASVVYPKRTAAVVIVVFSVPAMLTWLRCRRPVPHLVGLGAVAAVLCGSFWFGASAAYNRYAGPATPMSPRTALPADAVRWLWTGAVTESSATVSARLTRMSQRVRLVVSERADLSRPVAGPPAATSAGHIVTLSIGGLRADTVYHFGVEINRRLDAKAGGRFRTFPTGPASFTFAFGADTRTGSNAAVFDAIGEMDPLLFINAGDFFYANVDGDDRGRFRAEYDATLRAPAQAALYRSTAVAYMWDDHDYGENDADGTAPSRAAARDTYDELVPHYPLLTKAPRGPIFQAFTIGRVRFLLTDTRSARSPPKQADDQQKTMLGEEQLAWFKHELLGADKYHLVVWVNPDPWIGAPQAHADTWAGYDTERRAIANFIDDHRVDNLLMLSGDAHMIAIDDGTHSDYSDRGGDGFPVFHAAALDRRGEVKGGPYSSGTYPGAGRFGVVQITDDGIGRVAVTLSGRDHTGKEIVRHRFTVTAPD